MVDVRQHILEEYPSVTNVAAPVRFGETETDGSLYFIQN